MVLNPSTPQQVRKNFADILKAVKELEKYSGTNHYQAHRSQVEIKLVAFLRDDFRALNAKQLLHLCALVSTYRPVQPFSFLVSCSLLHDLTKQGK